MTHDNFKVALLGANGTMGPPTAVMFATGGLDVVMLARDMDKAREAIRDAQEAARVEAITERLTPGAYAADLQRAVGEAGLVFESLAENLALKREFLAKIDRSRGPDCIIATGSSGLSITEMARGRSDSFRRNFLGIHFFQPPNMLAGAELIPHAETDPAVTKRLATLLATKLGRKVIVTRDRPAFVANRVGFKVLNETAQLAEEYGVAFLDYIIGRHTGRGMTPLQNIDLVGWDVHKAIVDNVWANTEDEAHACFRLPEYMEREIAEGSLGDKTPEAGGFYRKNGRTLEVLDPKSGDYRPFEKPAPVEFVEKMKQLNRVGRYEDALGVLAEAQGAEADLARRVIFGYVSYALNRVNEVAESVSDVDTIMSSGFKWAPPTVFVDVLGPRRAIDIFHRYGLVVPPVVEQAAASGSKLFTGGLLEYGLTFIG